MSDPNDVWTDFSQAVIDRALRDVPRQRDANGSPEDVSEWLERVKAKALELCEEQKDQSGAYWNR